MREIAPEDQTAAVAFMSSAIAGFKPQKAKYKNPDDYAMEVADFALATAQRCFAAYKAWEATAFVVERVELDEDGSIVYDSDEDEEEE